MARADRLFRAFSDRTRLRLLALLARGERCVCDLVEVVRLPQPTVSRHLAYLRKAGLVRARKDGLWIYYRLAPAKSAFHAKLLECLGCCFKEVPEFKRDAKRLGRCAPNSACCA
ncbi:MAG: metalloregulator ArsR/SmtB family transcription factor [Planctomycetota bacterium]|nr:metalloregulator ArsR/SmtB family transcription factor [Planctomycetota bacterium]